MNKNYELIKKILSKNSINFEEMEHPAVETCEDSARFRLEKWMVWLGSKNIIFHCKWNFYLVVTHAAKQIKARNFKHEFGSKDIRFASQEEIDNAVWAKIWSIPPFGFENENLPIYVDEEIFESEYFIFNPSDPCRSIRINTNDLRKIYSNLSNPIKYFTHKEDKFELIENE